MSDLDTLRRLRIAEVGHLQRLFVLRSANMAVTTDQPFQKVFDGTLWLPTHIVANRISGAFGVACVGGIYTAAAKGGTALVAAAQSWALLTGALTSVTAALAVASIQSTAALYLSLTTGNTGALTADHFVYGLVLD